MLITDEEFLDGRCERLVVSVGVHVIYHPGTVYKITLVLPQPQHLLQLAAWTQRQRQVPGGKSNIQLDFKIIAKYVEYVHNFAACVGGLGQHTFYENYCQ